MLMVGCVRVRCKSRRSGKGRCSRGLVLPPPIVCTGRSSCPRNKHGVRLPSLRQFAEVGMLRHVLRARAS